MLSILIGIGIGLVQLTAGQNESTCYADISHPYQQFATYTAYEVNKDTSPISVPNCKPQQFWMISRHGTRYPSKYIVPQLKMLPVLRDEIINNHELQNRGVLCATDLANLKNWNLQVVSTLTSNLAPQGYQDLHDLAVRYKAQFPSLLNQTFTDQLFQFRFSDTQRTTASAFSFAEGMFGATNRVKLPEPMSPDLLIRPYDNCKNWKVLWPGNEEESRRFGNTTAMRTVLEEVSQRLGFNRTLTNDEVKAMYDGCRFDHAWHLREVSAWCAVFTEADLQVLEYKEDLLMYYYAGYGTDINIKLGCPPIKDFIDRFSEIVEGNQQPAGVFYFTHSEMLEMVLLPLGIAKDEQHLSHSNYDSMKQRLWKSSNITPLAANLVVILYKCDEGEPFRVQLLLNERPVDLDGCQQGLCDWTFFKNKFGSISSNCSLDFCGTGK